MKRVQKAFSAIAVSAVVVPSLGTDIHVDPSATAGLQNGQSWADAFLSLQGALAAAQVGDQILLAEGTYLPGAVRADSFEMPDGLKLVIEGGYAGLQGTDPYEHNPRAISDHLLR